MQISSNIKLSFSKYFSHHHFEGGFVPWALYFWETVLVSITLSTVALHTLRSQ